MKNIKRVLIIIFLSLFFLSGCGIGQSNTLPNKSAVGISKYPPAADYSFIAAKIVGSKTLPSYNPDSLKGWQVDIRSADLTSFDLTNKGYDLLNSCFDSKTKWPQKLPKEFNPEKVLNDNKNPGLNISKLHEKGITGKGVNVAIVDYALLVDHKEVENRVKMYEEIHCLDNQASMHAPGVTSIAVGKTTGVAPEANLYFIGNSNFNSEENGMEVDFTWEAKAIDRIVEVNKTLPKDQKIRVLSISSAWCPGLKGYDEITKAVNKAVKEGIFVISCNMFETYKEAFYFHGLTIDTISDRDNSDSYSVINWPKWISMVKNIGGVDKYYEKHFDEDKPKEILLIPIDSKTTASPTGQSDYVFYKDGGWSWIMPYLSGLYALACQVNPDITPNTFWNAALSTGEVRKITKGDKDYTGKIVNPEKLIEIIKKQ